MIKPIFEIGENNNAHLASCWHAYLCQLTVLNAI